jgi:hypothetical protein
MEPVAFEIEVETDLFKTTPIEVTGDYYADEYGNIAVVIRQVCIGSANITKDSNLGLLANRVRNIIKKQRPWRKYE